MTFEEDIKNAIDRQNQNYCTLEEQYFELKEIIEKYYKENQKVKDAIKGCYWEKAILKKLGLDE